MSYGEFDFAEGTEFEKKVMKFLWKRNPNRGKMYCKPDIYDVERDVFYEAKCTRPYFDKNPELHSDAVDIGDGLPYNQFMRYEIIRKSRNSRVILIHKLTEGKYANKVFITELTDEMVSKVKYSSNGKTVYWLYEDLKLREGIVL